MAKDTTKQLPSSERGAIQKPTGGFDPDAVLAESRKITSNDFYEIERYDKATGGYKKFKKPTARALQYEANQSGMGGIATRIVEAGINKDQGWARVQGWPKNDPSYVKEEQVTITFDIELASLLFDRISKGCEYHKNGCPIIKDEKQQPIIDTKTGLPVLVDGKEQLQIIQQLVRIKKFADRTCITKCEARLHEKFLNMEWRDPEEVEHEQSEVAIVSDSKKVSGAEQQVAQNKPAEVKTEAAKLAVEKPKPIEEPATKAKEAPPKAPPADTKTQDNGGVPRAQIPGPVAVTVKERAARLGVKTAASETHVVQFLARQLGVEAIKPEHKPQVVALLTASENLLERGVPPFEFGAYIRGEKDEKTEKIKGQLDSLLAWQ